MTQHRDVPEHIKGFIRHQIEQSAINFLGEVTKLFTEEHKGAIVAELSANYLFMGYTLLLASMGRHKADEVQRLCYMIIDGAKIINSGMSQSQATEQLDRIAERYRIKRGG